VTYPAHSFYPANQIRALIYPTKMADYLMQQYGLHYQIYCSPNLVHGFDDELYEQTTRPVHAAWHLSHAECPQVTFYQAIDEQTATNGPPVSETAHEPGASTTIQYEFRATQNNIQCLVAGKFRHVDHRQNPLVVDPLHPFHLQS